MAPMPGAPARNRRLRVNLDPDGIFPAECNATSKRSGLPCQRDPYLGSPVCLTHGARAPHVRAAADRRVAELTADRAMRAILANVPFMDLDATPVTDPAGALTVLAGRLGSGAVETAKRINTAIEAGREPSEVDVVLLRVLLREERQILTDMTRLQVGVAMYGHQAAQNGAGTAQNGDLTASEDQLALGGAPADLPSLAAIVESVIASESAAETDRLVRLKAVEVQQSPPAHLAVVDDGAGGSIAV